MRNRDINVCSPEGDSDLDEGICSVSPFLFTNTQGSRLREHTQLPSEDVDFTKNTALKILLKLRRINQNQLVEIRTGVNMANNLGTTEKTVGTRICPYVGETREAAQDR